MVDPALVDRASKPYAVKSRFKVAWISYVAAVLAIAIIVGVWGGNSFFSIPPLGGDESTPSINPLGSGPDATPEETPHEVTPDGTTPEVTPPEVTPGGTTPEVTPPEVTPDTPFETSPLDPDENAELLEKFKQKYLEYSGRKYDVYHAWYYGEIEQGHVAVILREYSKEFNGSEYMLNVGDISFPFYGAYLEIFMLTSDEEKFEPLDAAYNDGLVSDAEVEDIFRYWVENLQSFYDLYYERYEPPMTTPNPNAIDRETVIEIIKNTYYADTYNERQIYNVYYYGEVENGHIAIVVHSRETRVFMSSLKYGGKTFENYGTYANIYIVFPSMKAYDLGNMGSGTVLTSEEVNALYDYWRNNITDFLREAQMADKTAPETTPAGIPEESPPAEPAELADQMKAIRNAFRSDTNNQYKIYHTWYYGEIEQGYVAFLIHEYKYDYNGSDIKIQGYEFNENSAYFDIYILPYGAEKACDITSRNVTVSREATKEIYDYWLLNKHLFTDILIEAGEIEATTPETTPGVTPVPETTPESVPETQPPQNLEELLPPDIDLGEEMSILVGTAYYDEWLEADDGDLVGTELYCRVPRVEQSLGITLNVTCFAGQYYNDSFSEEVKKRQESSDPNMIVDVVSGTGQYIGNMIIEGRFMNIADSDNIDFDNPWWPKDLVNSALDGKYYYVSGDISPTLLYETYVIFYNEGLVDDFGLEDPIDLVTGHKWTLDKLIQITSGLFDDRDGSEKPSKGDLIAFNFNDIAHYKALTAGAGIRVMVPDTENGYTLSPNIVGSAEMGGIYNKINQWVKQNKGVNSPSIGYSDYNTGFMNGDVVFNLGTIGSATFYYAGNDVSYGFVPCPMRSEAQGEYYSGYGFPATVWTVPTNAPSLDNSATLLEYLAADAYVNISPAIFAKITSSQYQPGASSGLSAMFDIVRRGIVFDPGITYKQNITGFRFFTELTSGNSSWSAEYSNASLKIIKANINNIARTIRENAG